MRDGSAAFLSGLISFFLLELLAVWNVLERSATFSPTIRAELSRVAGLEVLLSLISLLLCLAFAPRAIDECLSWYRQRLKDLETPSSARVP